LSSVCFWRRDHIHRHQIRLTASCPINIKPARGCSTTRFADVPPISVRSLRIGKPAGGFSMFATYVVQPGLPFRLGRQWAFHIEKNKAFVDACSVLITPNKHVAPALHCGRPSKGGRDPLLFLLRRLPLLRPTLQTGRCPVFPGPPRGGRLVTPWRLPEGRLTAGRSCSARHVFRSLLRGFRSSIRALARLSVQRLWSPTPRTSTAGPCRKSARCGPVKFAV